MSCTPPISDLSHLYYGATSDDATSSVLGASTLRGNTNNLGVLHMNRRQLGEDPRTQLLLGGVPPSLTSSSAYEEELLARHQAAQSANLLRRYHELKVLEAASAAASVSLTRASDLIAATNLPPRRMSPSTLGARMSPTSMHSLEAGELSSVGGGGCCFAQRYQGQGFGRASSAFERIDSSARGPPFPPSSVEIPMQMKQHREEGKGVVAASKSSSSDAAAEPEDEEAFFQTSSGSTKERFPVKLYRMIYEMEKEGRADVVSFLPHGKAFAILKEDVFVKEILPRYFANCQLSSLQKQLNLYGFHKITVGKDKGKLHYFHSSFLKGKPSLTDKIQRRRTRGGATKRKESF